LQGGCNLKEKDKHYLPKFKVEEFSYLKPFETIIKIVQEKRRDNPKGTITNLMYKRLGIVSRVNRQE